MVTRGNRLTIEELEEIRERAEKAVYAPWRIGRQSPNGLYYVGSTDGLLIAQTTNEANVAFIAHAREDIPKLLAEIERLQKSVEYCKQITGGLTRENAILKGEKPITVHLNGGDDE